MIAPQRPNQMRNGRFTIVRPLSKGGMGALYLASETIATGTRKVVIKEMLDYFDSSDPKGQAKAQRRFETEAITLANLSIPGIPQVFDYFSEGGRNYIVMQFIEGQNLETGLSRLDERGYAVKGRPYPVENVRRWGIVLCKLLESLAVQSVIHMDIKPANLILDKSGTVWLVDFGTAKAPRSAPPGGPAIVPSGLQKSSVYGTLGYAAPEQAAGKPEVRSDVYALAATLYHLATDDDPGSHPGKFPQIDRLPADFNAAIKRALVLDVHKRSTAREFGLALEPRNTRSLGFHWQDGTTSQDPVDLATAADDRWEEARVYFSGSAWENWLQDMHRHDLAASLAQIKRQVKDPDLGLDGFLRVLYPNLPAAILLIPATILDAGMLPWRSQRILDVEVQNSGRGALQVRFPNMPAGVRAIPDTLAVHRRQTFKLVIDSNMLSPSPKTLLIPIALDAGPAGRARLRISLTIPAPVMEIEPPQLDLGAVYRGQAVTGELYVRNTGNSAFKCEIMCQLPDAGVDPGQFDCLPGSEYLVNICVDTHQMGLGLHASEVKVHAQAGGWEQTRFVEVDLQVSTLKTMWKYGGPILAWAAACGFYGGFLGWFLATLIGSVEGQVSSAVLGALAGALLGVLLCLFPAMALGGLGWLSAPPGKAGLRTGAMIGGISGALAGGLAGALIGWIGVGVEVFGALVGGISGAILGVLFQRRLKF
jgi:serine/threonine protein kinase